MRQDWSYLPNGRWAERVVYTWSGSTYAAQSTNRFIWDGNVLLAVLDHTNGLVTSFLRGSDLSGTSQGAGGAGGVIATTITGSGTHFAAVDGNGHVAGLVSAADGKLSAIYEYAPFGETIRETGSAAKQNPMRFSTQFADDVNGDCKYVHRPLHSATGRWKSRDPLGERGGISLYSFVQNAPQQYIDTDGREIIQINASWGPITTVGRLEYVGFPVTGVVIGKFRYPRRDQCGCWERNIYADFKPIAPFLLQHAQYVVTYQHDFSPEADVLEVISDLTDFFAPPRTARKVITDPMDWAGLIADIGAAQLRRLHTYYFTTVQEMQNLQAQPVRWSIDKIYFKDGESTKISNKTCKPSEEWYSEATIKALTKGFTPRFAYLPVGGWTPIGPRIFN
jgi:RHS repeat-associated protein